MKFVKYYGKTILVFELESLNKPICYNNTFYERENNETIKVEGADSIMALLARFN